LVDITANCFACSSIASEVIRAASRWVSATRICAAAAASAACF
jgi:hypothetical protein